MPPETMLWRFLAYYGWIILSVLFLRGALDAWLLYVQTGYAKTIKYTFLAIDVPRGNEQSPKAMENMFTYLGGAHGTINFFEKWWEGKFQVSFSFEIVSIDGYTQFIVRTPVDFKNLVESAIYSQYPDAEIVEIDDYTEGIPKKYPDEEYDVWGAEFIPSANHMLPIKLYREFEHLLGPSEMVFKDPMASLMDLCSSLQKGEQLWYQIIVIPTDFDWVKEAEPEIDKIVGKKPKVSKANAIIDTAVNTISDLSEQVYSLWGDVETKEKEFKPLSMMELRPKQKKQIEGMHNKVSRLGFLGKIRFVYVAKKEVFNPKKVTSGFVGYIKQFSALDLNGLKPDMKYTATSTAYFAKVKRLNEKKGKIVTNYMNRSGWAGRNPTIYNVEELATLWHFPLEAAVKAPLIQKTPGKKAKPPMALPTEVSTAYQDSLEPIYSLEELQRDKYLKEEIASIAEIKEEEKEITPAPVDSISVAEKRSTPPPNLPFA